MSATLFSALFETSGISVSPQRILGLDHHRPHRRMAGRKNLARPRLRLHHRHYSWRRRLLHWRLDFHAPGHFRRRLSLFARRRYGWRRPARLYRPSLQRRRSLIALPNSLSPDRWLHTRSQPVQKETLRRQRDRSARPSPHCDTIPMHIMEITFL